MVRLVPARESVFKEPLHNAWLRAEDLYVDKDEDGEDEEDHDYTVSEISNFIVMGPAVGSAPLRFWMTSFSDTLLFKLAVEQLLSIRTVGSMAVERVAKTLKHSIQTSTRNRIADPNAEWMLRGSMDLKLLEGKIRPMELARSVHKRKQRMQKHLRKQATKEGALKIGTVDKDDEEEEEEEERSSSIGEEQCICRKFPRFRKFRKFRKF